MAHLRHALGWAPLPDAALDDIEDEELDEDDEDEDEDEDDPDDDQPSAVS